MDLLRLHLPQQFVNWLAFGHIGGWPHDRLDLLHRLTRTEFMAARHDVLEIGDTDDVILIFPDDGDPGEAAAKGERQRLPKCLVTFDEDDLGAWHHHLTRQGVAELKDRVDHLPFARLDHPPLLEQVHEIAQLGLGREGALPEALARRESVPHADEQARQRAEDPRKRMQNDRCSQAERTRASPEHADEYGGHENYSGQLARDPQQQENIEVPRDVTIYFIQPPRAATALRDKIFDVGS